MLRTDPGNSRLMSGTNLAILNNHWRSTGRSAQKGTELHSQDEVLASHLAEIEQMKPLCLRGRTSRARAEQVGAADHPVEFAIGCVGNARRKRLLLQSHM